MGYNTFNIYTAGLSVPEVLLLLLFNFRIGKLFWVSDKVLL